MTGCYSGIGTQKDFKLKSRYFIKYQIPERDLEIFYARRIDRTRNGMRFDRRTSSVDAQGLAIMVEAVARG